MAMLSRQLPPGAWALVHDGHSIKQRKAAAAAKAEAEAGLAAIAAGGVAPAIGLRSGSGQMVTHGMSPTGAAAQGFITQASKLGVEARRVVSRKGAEDDNCS